MEPEQTTVAEEKHNPLFKVTPLSKYLAMLLFIAMPFIGGYIGYTYAPEKVVEVERVVVDESAKETISKTYKAVLSEPNGFDPFASIKKDLYVDDVMIGNLRLANRYEGPLTTSITFVADAKPTQISGTFTLYASHFSGDYRLRFEPDDKTIGLLPWPSTSETAIDSYDVTVKDQPDFIDNICDEDCKQKISDIDNPEQLIFTGFATVHSVRYEVENIGVDSFPYSIEVYDLELQLLEEQKVSFNFPSWTNKKLVISGYSEEDLQTSLVDTDRKVGNSINYLFSADEELGEVYQLGVDSMPLIKLFRRDYAISVEDQIKAIVYPEPRTDFEEQVITNCKLRKLNVAVIGGEPYELYFAGTEADLDQLREDGYLYICNERKEFLVYDDLIIGVMYRPMGLTGVPLIVRVKNISLED